MGAFIELGGLFMQMVFLAVVLSVVGIGVNRFLTAHFASRQSLKKDVKKVSHADAARARAQARQRARLQVN